MYDLVFVKFSVLLNKIVKILSVEDFMINVIYNYANHTIIGTIIEGIPALFVSIQTRINRIAMDVLIQITISIPLFYLHHNLFALGFVIGFIFDKQIREIVNKVDIVYKAHQTLLERVLFFGGGGFLAILSMPTSIVIATLYYSAQWGASLYQSCLARHLQNAPIGNAKEEEKDIEAANPPNNLVPALDHMVRAVVDNNVLDEFIEAEA